LTLLYDSKASPSGAEGAVSNDDFNFLARTSPWAEANLGADTISSLFAA
jgi:hypothetical protein